MTAIGQNGHAFEDASADVNDNRDVVLAATGQDGHALETHPLISMATAMLSWPPSVRLGMPSGMHPQFQ